jgi:hypothetical protein
MAGATQSLPTALSYSSGTPTQVFARRSYRQYNNIQCGKTAFCALFRLPKEWKKAGLCAIAISNGGQPSNEQSADQIGQHCSNAALSANYHGAAEGVQGSLGEAAAKSHQSCAGERWKRPGHRKPRREALVRAHQKVRISPVHSINKSSSVACFSKPLHCVVV